MRYRLSQREKLIAAGAGVLFLLTLTAAVFFIASRVTKAPEVGTDVPFIVDSSGTEETGLSYTRPGNEEKSYNFLVCGSDSATGLYDTMILLHLSGSGQINAVQLPRDTYIESGQKAMKLNAFVSSLGAEKAARELEKILCVKIDYTVTLSTSAFAKAIDAIGGVEFDVPMDMDYDDPYQDLHIHLKKGLQTLDGERAEHFVRFRSGYSGGDLDRLDAQKKFMKTLLSQLREKLDLSAVSAIISEVLPLINTSLDLDECVYFARRVLSANTGAAGLSMMTLPGKALDYEGQSYYVIGREAVLETVNEYLNVYTTDVEDSLFDRDRSFVLDGNDDFERIYTYSLITVKTEAGQ